VNQYYSADIKQHYAALSLREQKDLYIEIKKGNKQAREALINSCLPLVVDIAKGFIKNNKHVGFDDLIQEGNIALISAVDKWTGNNSITTVATTYIKNAFIDVIQQARYNMRIKCDPSEQASIDICKIQKVQSNDLSTISKETGLTEKRILKLLGVANGKRVDFNSFNPHIHCKDNHEVKSMTSLNGCLADLISLTHEHIVDQKDKTIFLCWINHVNQNSKTRIVSKETGFCLKDISESVKRTRKILKKAELNNE